MVDVEALESWREQLVNDEPLGRFNVGVVVNNNFKRLLAYPMVALPLAVIEGDQQTRLDAERIRAAGAPAIQINTGRGCHLDAQMVGDAFARLNLHAQAHHHGHRHQPAHEHSHQHHSPEALLFIERWSRVRSRSRVVKLDP